MTARTFSTNLTAANKLLSRWLFIIGGLFLTISQGYNYLVSFNIFYLGGCIVGIWILNQGLFFNYFIKNIALTIDAHFIRYHHSKTIFKAEKTEVIQWSNIKIIILSNYSIRLLLKDGTKAKYKLRIYNPQQYQQIKDRLQKLTKANDAAFKTVHWFKKVEQFKIARQDQKAMPTAKKPASKKSSKSPREKK